MDRRNTNRPTSQERDDEVNDVEMTDAPNANANANTNMATPSAKHPSTTAASNSNAAAVASATSTPRATDHPKESSTSTSSSSSLASGLIFGGGAAAAAGSGNPAPMTTATTADTLGNPSTTTTATPSSTPAAPIPNINNSGGGSGSSGSTFQQPSQQQGRPTIPEEYLRCVVSPLYTAECSNKTFRNILTIIEHLSHLPGARDVFLRQLATAADALCQSVVEDLRQLEITLEKTQEEIEVQRITLQRCTPADSNQAKLLRVIKTIDYIHTKRKTLLASAEGGPAQATGGLVGSSASVGGGFGFGGSSARNAFNNLFLLRSESANFAEGHRGSPAPSEGSVGNLVSNVAKRTPSLDELVLQFEKPGFHQVWLQLNACLLLVQQNPKMVFVATVLLPLIECLMIVCKYMLAYKEKHGATQSPASTTPGATHLSTAHLAMSPLSPTSPHHSHMSLHDLFAKSQQQGGAGRLNGDEVFYAFTEKHRKILNTLVRSNPKLLRGSFSLLIRNPKVLEFDSKRNYFNQQLHSKAKHHRGNVIYVNVRRQYIFQDSYYQLQNRSGEELRHGKLSIRFHDEEGADYGGVSREWYQELTKEMVNPNYALFTPSAEKMGVTYQPNPSSWVNPSHLLYFKFVGRIIGKAIYDGRLLECYFTRAVYKHILGKPVDMSDMEAIDPEYHKSLKWILENSINDVLDLTFSTEMDEFGQQKIIDLKPNGRNLPVTDDNKHEYVSLIVENRLTTAIREQINAFLAGFHEIISKDLIAIFSEKELELLISGVPDIDIDDWKNNTDYRGYTSTSAQVQWFWRAVRSFDQEERAKLLQFTTGTSKVPLEGFANLQGMGGKQKFQIHKDFGKVERLPSAHTCFNQLDLPVYESYEQLKERLLISINEAATGFGFE